MTTALLDLPTFEYEKVAVSDMEAVGARDEKKGTFEPKGIKLPDGRVAKPTERFWTAMCSRFQFGQSTFRLFDPYEVFERIGDTSRFPDDTVNVCIQTSSGKDDYHFKDEPLLWGMSKPNRSMLSIEQISLVLNTIGVEEVEFYNGLVIGRYTPGVLKGLNKNVGPDEFKYRVQVEIPVDGYGDPAAFLTMVRTVCTNGVIARSKMFKSQLQLGTQDPVHTATRLLDTFQNEEGFTALTQRIESSQTTHASVHESIRALKLLAKIDEHSFKDDFFLRAAEESGEADQGKVGKSLRGDLLKSFHRLSGNLRGIYGVADLNSISEKRQKCTPTPLCMYTLINFLTEVATHQLKPNAAANLNALVGDLLSKEYDLENSMTEVGEFADFLMPQRGSNN